jgi:hypothetical protein
LKSFFSWQKYSDKTFWYVRAFLSFFSGIFFALNFTEWQKMFFMFEKSPLTDVFGLGKRNAVAQFRQEIKNTTRTA